jgi:hypothetical protein
MAEATLDRKLATPPGTRVQFPLAAAQDDAAIRRLLCCFAGGDSTSNCEHYSLSLEVSLARARGPVGIRRTGERLWAMVIIAVPLSSSVRQIGLCHSFLKIRREEL